jgi:hypothetical protein
MIEALIIRTLSDTLPKEKADAVFLFGQTRDNQLSVFKTAVYLVRKEIVSRVMFVNSKALSGYPGFEAWKQELAGLGISKEVDPVPIDADVSRLNTRVEADAMIKHAKEKGYKQVIITAPPFQQTRAFMAAVTAAKKLYPQLKLYNCPGKALSWIEEVTHSQGSLTGTRTDLITSEMERIQKYTAKGDLAEIDEVLEYLKARDLQQP